MGKLIARASKRENEYAITLHSIHGEPSTFEHVVTLCYEVKIEVTASKLVYLRFSKQVLHMTKELRENKLI